MVSHSEEKASRTANSRSNDLLCSPGFVQFKFKFILQQSQQWLGGDDLVPSCKKPLNEPVVTQINVGT